jgi:hypothetical protein
VSTTSGVPRTARVTSMKAVKQIEPASAISAGPVSVAVEGRIAMITPTKPATTALQRRQPTFSPRNSAENAVM